MKGSDLKEVAEVGWERAFAKEHLSKLTLSKRKKPPPFCSLLFNEQESALVEPSSSFHFLNQVLHKPMYLPDLFLLFQNRHASPAGLLLTAVVAISYTIAVLYEG